MIQVQVGNGGSDDRVKFKVRSMRSVNKREGERTNEQG
jgi:hypothetical protein